MNDAVKTQVMRQFVKLAALVPAPGSCGCAAGKARSLKKSCMFLLKDEGLCRECLGKVWVQAEEDVQSPLERGIGLMRGQREYRIS